MGRTKGDLVYDGATLAERAARTLWPLCGGILISVAPGAPNPAPAFPFLEDPEPQGLGPLAGIASAFRATGGADLLVLACDYPGVTSELLRALVACCDARDDLVMPVDGRGCDHPLVALWRRGAEHAVRSALDQGSLKVRSIFAELNVRRLTPRDIPSLADAVTLENWNFPEDRSARLPTER